MKNHYLRFGMMICILVLAIFLVSGVIFTKNKTDEFNNNVKWRIDTIDYFVTFQDDNTGGYLEQAVSGSWEQYFKRYPTENTGFYSSLIELSNGNVIIDSDDAGFENNLTDADLNTRARKISDGYTAAYSMSDHPGGLVKTDTGVFNTTVIEICNTGYGRFIITYCAVFRPFQSVLKDSMTVYLAGLLLFLIVEAVVLSSVIILYRNQKNYEIRNQKLTRGIAHELKTPLAVTKATVENWEYLDEEQRHEYSGNIVSEVDHMSDMINKLLEVSQINGGNIKLNRQPVDLMLLTREIKDRNNELIRERLIDFTVKGTGDAYTVFADPGMMNIVIGNFMSNAIKYCDHFITVKLERSGRKITFSITNDGTRIDKNDLDKIWDVFYTTDKARTNRISNSGVGLSVVKSILDAHKAKYGCSSGTKGTVFWFSMNYQEPSA